jgi:hypothetical protein
VNAASDIRVLTRDDPEFYPLMGPFLASRAVFRDLGEQPWDEPGKVWWVMTAGGAVAGFLAAADAGAYVAWGSAWVVPERRRRGLWAALAGERDTASAGREVRVLCRPALEGAYLRMGFSVAARTARYVRMRRLP